MLLNIDQTWARDQVDVCVDTVSDAITTGVPTVRVGVGVGSNSHVHLVPPDAGRGKRFFHFFKPFSGGFFVGVKS